MAARAGFNNKMIIYEWNGIESALKAHRQINDGDWGSCRYVLTIA